MRNKQKTEHLRKISGDKVFYALLIVTIPSLFLWTSATLSFLYINYIGPFIFSLPGFGEFFIFLMLPLVGTLLGFFAYKKSRNKIAKYLFTTNLILLIFVIFSSFLLS